MTLTQYRNGYKKTKTKKQCRNRVDHSNDTQPYFTVEARFSFTVECMCFSFYHIGIIALNSKWF